MSFWGATVITNLLSAIPYLGTDIVEWLWGGFSVDKDTLARFYILHFFLPFVITALVLIHMFLLHLTGSNNPIGISMGSDGGSTFSPFYLVKDLFGLFVFFIFFGVFLFMFPNTMGHPDNYTRANPLVTPAHIVPEWYFLPFYAILRSIPDKLAGVLALFLGILSLALLPFIHKPETRSMRFRPFSRSVFWLFVITCIILGFLGSKPIEPPYLLSGQLATISYFSYFFVLGPHFISREYIAWTPIYDNYVGYFRYTKDLWYIRTPLEVVLDQKDLFDDILFLINHCILFIGFRIRYGKRFLP